ncbi:DotA/TraY family protein [Morganella morganii]|uniref:DotA/TraY family protein n=1 Tax=Morganella morganii TaxID=582 RepID=UPI0025436790|nr:DotA/TraY family protein [Morganella morganii]
MIKKILLIMAMLLYATNASADTFSMDWLTPLSTDWFMNNFVDKYLNPEALGVFSGIMALFLSFLLVLGGILAAYTLIAGTMATAHDGEMLGKKWSSMWLPIRTALGTAMLLPMPTGFCAIHMVIYSFIKAGVGLAGTMIPLAIACITIFFDYSSVSSNLEIRKLAKDTLLGAACVQIYNEETARELAQSSKYFRGNVQYFSVQNFEAKSDGKRVIGYNFGGLKDDWNTGDKSQMCGFLRLDVSNSGEQQNALASGSGYKPLVDVSSIQNAVQQAQAKALNKMVLDAIAYSDTLVKADPANPKPINDKIEEMTAAYKKSMNDAGKLAMAQAIKVDSIADITEKGWAFFGAYYMKIVQSINGTNAAMNSIPASSGQAAERLNYLADRFGPRFEKVKHIVNRSDKLNADTTNIAGEDSSLFTSLLRGANSNGGIFMGDGKVDQLLSITQQVNVGNHVLNGVAAMGIGASSVSLLALIPKLSDVLIAAGTIIGPFFSFLMIVGLINGIMLAYVIPMIPYIIWMGIVLSYMATCIEAYVASPMWVLAHLAPDADDVVGKQGQGYMLTLVVTLKPGLAIFGFLASFVMMCAGAALINATFLIATSFVDSGWLGITYSIAMIAVYMCLNLNNTMNATRVMSTLPDTVLEWIGARATSLGGKVMGGSEEALNSAKSNTTNTVERAGQATASSMSNMARNREKKRDIEPKGGNEGNIGKGNNQEPTNNTTADKGNHGQSITDLNPKE